MLLNTANQKFSKWYTPFYKCDDFVRDVLKSGKLDPGNDYLFPSNVLEEIRNKIQLHSKKENKCNE